MINTNTDLDTLLLKRYAHLYEQCKARSRAC